MTDHHRELLTATVLAGLLANPGVNPNTRKTQDAHISRAIAITDDLIDLIERRKQEVEPIE